jgi:hypothetical protein
MPIPTTTSPRHDESRLATGTSVERALAAAARRAPASRSESSSTGARGASARGAAAPGCYPFHDRGCTGPYLSSLPTVSETRSSDRPAEDPRRRKLMDAATRITFGTRDESAIWGIPSNNAENLAKDGNDVDIDADSWRHKASLKSPPDRPKRPPRMAAAPPPPATPVLTSDFCGSAGTVTLEICSPPSAANKRWDHGGDDHTIRLRSLDNRKSRRVRPCHRPTGDKQRCARPNFLFDHAVRPIHVFCRTLSV